jgi:hypothetical protein
MNFRPAAKALKKSLLSADEAFNGFFLGTTNDSPSRKKVGGIFETFLD